MDAKGKALYDRMVEGKFFAGTGTAGELNKKDPVHPTTPGLTHSTCRNGCARVSSGEDTIELPMENVTYPKYAVRDQRVQGGCK